MSPSAARACRADRRVGGAGGKIPRAFKRAWALMTPRERGHLRRKWRMAQVAILAAGERKHQLQLQVERAAWQTNRPFFEEKP